MTKFSLNNCDDRSISPPKEKTIDVDVYIDGQEAFAFSGAFIHKGEENTPLVVPLVKLLSSLGVDIFWEKDDIATLEYKSKQYVLNLNDESLFSADDTNTNLLWPPPGCVFANEVIDKEIFVEYGLFTYIARIMGIEIVSVDLDDEAHRLSINFK